MKRILLGDCAYLMLAMALLSCQPSGPAEDELTQEIDQIFEDWNQPDRPGGSIGVMKDGEIIYAKGHGMASLEHDIKNSANTKYNIASVSKQFTAYAMLLLESQGKLSVDDEIHKFFPELADFGNDITIRHMVHHTSGFRSLHALLIMAGWRGSDRRTNEDLLRFMQNQKELNFEPGAEYLYCNTGYILMAEIVEKVTGQDFITWMDENVFEPLGMDDTYVEADYTAIVPNNAHSYNYARDENAYRFSVPYWGYIGSGNIHTTIFDLLKWQQHINNPPTNHADMIAKMFNKGVLNSGDTLNYAYGININEDYKGERTWGHGGSIGGFRASIVSIPEQNLNVVVLTNHSNAGAGGKAYAVIDAVLDKEPTAPRERNSDRDEPIYLPITSTIAGSYYSPELETTYRLEYSSKDSVEIYHSRHGSGWLKMTAPDTLNATAPYAIRRITFVREDGTITGLRASNGRVRNMWFEKGE